MKQDDGSLLGSLTKLIPAGIKLVSRLGTPIMQCLIGAIASNGLEESLWGWFTG